MDTTKIPLGLLSLGSGILIFGDLFSVTLNIERSTFNPIHSAPFGSGIYLTSCRVHRHNGNNTSNALLQQCRDCFRAACALREFFPQAITCHYMVPTHKFS